MINIPITNTEYRIHGVLQYNIQNVLYQQKKKIT